MANLHIASNKGEVILYAPDRITRGEGADALRNAVKSLSSAGFPKIVVNFSGTSFIDSAGLGTLVAAHHFAKINGGKLSLQRLNSKFREILEITKLSTVFHFDNRKQVRGLPEIEIDIDDVSGIRAARALPLILSLRNNRIRVELGMQDGVYKVRPEKTSQSVIIASPYVISEATHTLRFDDVKEFEELINSSRTREDDIHRFLEEHPKFLLAHEYQELHSKVLLERELKGPLIPDFMLQPFDTELCDLLELKLPRESLIVGPCNRRRFSGAVHEAVAQLRAYRDFFEDKGRREEILRLYKIKAYRPRMTVVIGRMTSMDPIEYRRIVEGQKEVKVMTYDELLARAKRFLAV